MERILRGEEISGLIEAACSYEKDCFYFPVRHHSPVCAFHLRRVIEEYRPDCILIEGPENANELIADMVAEDTEAPFCIYYSYRDSKRLLNEEKEEEHRCYYPFLDYSPELVAMREGQRMGAELFFMDLPYEEILIAQKEGIGLRKQEEKSSYNDDRYLAENEFIKGVVEKSGLRGFDEFWERYFEMEGLEKATREFLRDMLYYCVLSRANTPAVTMREDGCLAREAYMRGRIAKAREKYRRVLVVTGGFHVAGLVGAQAWLIKASDRQGRDQLGMNGGEPSAGEQNEAVGGDLFGKELPEGLLVSEGERKLHSLEKKDKGVYLMSYSMAATDRLNGYCSGMPHPMFYQRIWEGICKEEDGKRKNTCDNPCGNEDGVVAGQAGRTKDSIREGKAAETATGNSNIQEIYEQVILRFLVETGRKVRRKEAYPSTYDEICAMTMCGRLAQLRGKRFPGVYELTDSVLSNYVKGEYQISTDRPMRVLREELTGDLIGKLTKNAKLPPLCLDFEKMCQYFRLDVHASTKKEMTISPFAKKKHRELSSFFYRMCFLNTDFVQLKKGPNLRIRKDRNLIREIWEYHFSPKVMAALIENSMYGGNIREACRTLAHRQFMEETDAAGASLLVVKMFEMGETIEEPAISQRLGEIIQGSEDFFALTKTFSNLIMLLDMQELYGYEAKLFPLRDMVAQKLLALLEHMSAVKDEDCAQMLEALKELYHVLLGKGMEEEQAVFVRTLEKMTGAPDLNPSLAGAVWGLLYAYGARSAGEVSDSTRGYLLACGDKAMKAADYVRGLFFVARDILFSQEGMLDMFDAYLGRISTEDFLKALPALRLAFSFFTPVEMDRLAGLVAGKYGLRRQEFQELTQVSDEELAYGRELEAEVLKYL